METMIVVLPIVAFVAAVGLVLSIYGTATSNRNRLADRLAGYTQPTGSSLVLGNAASTVLKERTYSGIPIIQDLLGGSGYAERVTADLAAAGLPLRVGEYLLIRWVSALALASLPSLTGRPVFLAVPLGLLGYFLPKLYVGRRQGQRIAKFNDQLCDALAMMANSMRSGSSFLQAIDLVAHELPPPIGEEFGFVVAEAGVGAAIEEALRNLTERIRSYDLYLAVTAILVQRQTGGSLAEVLDNIAATIRDRIRLLRQVQVLTAEQKLSAIVVGALPIFMVVVLQIITPSYYTDFIESPIGKIMFGAAATLQVAGFIAMHKISQIDI
jgi:tight adherence protein B